MRFMLSEKDGKTPVRCYDFARWAKWFNESDRQVGFDKIDDVAVSTIFLGRTTERRDGKPLLFETAVIGGPHAYPPELYCTWDEAEAGHLRWVELISARLDLVELMAAWAGPALRPVDEIELQMLDLRLAGKP